jgi:methylenetetrahydrofolate--tRNA-(uracil-5-)-methyltransferase
VAERSEVGGFTKSSKIKLKMTKINIIGGGLAGCEAAWQLAQRGFEVEIFEMRKISDHISIERFVDFYFKNILLFSVLKGAAS